MPYPFVDTIEPPATETMPAEAMKLNGEYIENQMDARYCKYRTLYVYGREMLSPEITSFETGVRDGSSFLSRRYPERVITIGFTLQAISNNYFRQAWNELNRILNVENAEIIFYDEQDKFFIGTPAGIEEEPAPGSNFVKGEFNIICNDPFKYSILEYEVEPTEDEGTTFVVEYNGTYPAHPTLEADFYQESECGDDGSSSETLTGDGDCGYVAWLNDQAKIIQLGDPEEEEGETYDKSQTLISQSFKNISSWTSELSNVWSTNGGTNHYIQTLKGTPGFKAGTNGNLLTAASFGSADTEWYGTSVYRSIPADATGNVGATDWTLKWTQEMHKENNSADVVSGCIQVMVSDANGKIIAGANSHAFGGTGKLWAHINGKDVKQNNSIDYSYNNSKWGANGNKGCSITKTGSTVTMNLGGTSWSFTDSSITNMVARTITITFAIRNLQPTPMPYMGVSDITFAKNNCETWADIPNKFTSNDIAIAECSTGEVLLNGTPSPEYGALGNDWESFYLSPGINQIRFVYSDWCELPPTSRMRYREVYL